MSQGSPGYSADLYVSGVSTAMTDEATTEVSGTVFQITSTAKRIIDHGVAVVVKVDTVVQSSGYEVNYNTGTVTFDTTQTTKTVTVTASYLPRFQVAQVRVINPEFSFDSADSSVCQDSAESNTLTILRARLGVELVQLLDTHAYTTTDLGDILLGKEIKVLECQPVGSGQKVLRIRGTFDGATWQNNGPADISSGTLSLIGAHDNTTMVSYDTI